MAQQENKTMRLVITMNAMKPMKASHVARASQAAVVGEGRTSAGHWGRGIVTSHSYVYKLSRMELCTQRYSRAVFFGIRSQMAKTESL